jgi:histidine kinase/GHKL domain-containing protein
MKQNKTKLTEIILLASVWILLISAPFLFNEWNYSSWQDFIPPLATTFSLFLIFILNRFLLVPKILLKKRNAIYIGSVVVMITIFSILVYNVNKFNNNSSSRTSPPHRNLLDYPPQHPQGNPPPNAQINPPPNAQINPPPNAQINPPPNAQINPPPNAQINPPPNAQINPPQHRRGNLPQHRLPNPRPIPAFANFLLLGILLIGFDTGLRISFKMIEIEKAKAKVEKENLGAQLAFLRNQVSPHFFMNTLNNIHSLIDFDTEKAKDSIIQLSKLMRHLLYDTDTEFIPIKKEVDFIKNYIDLMRLRFSEKVKIIVVFPDEIPDKSIPPLLFTSFLENAFKHGISYQKPSDIKIKLSLSDNKVELIVENPYSTNIENDDHSGIGIENSRKRLDLIYGDNYSLEIDDKNEIFFVKLSIPI